MMQSVRKASLWLVATVLCSSSLFSATREANLAEAVSRLRASATGRIETQHSRRTGHLSFVRAERGEVLVADSAETSPETRARAFLAEHGAVIGMSAQERALAAPARGVPFRVAPNAVAEDASELHLNRVDRDPIGGTHVRLAQFYRGLRVFGTELIVHMNERGITGVNGSFVPDVHLSIHPRLSSYDAMDIAQSMALKTSRQVPQIRASELLVYRIGLLEGFEGASALAWSIDVDSAGKAERMIIDANRGVLLLRYSLRPEALFRKIYSPSADESDLRRKEGDPPTFIPPIDNLYDFAGEVYNFFQNAFVRDSYDGVGAQMRSVYLVNDICPNAYWDSSTTNYCPGFDADDIVAHEWGHAYTEFTHNLIYAYQSGALNESYSDIWGETVDLNNGRDTLVGGTNNNQPHPNGQRWIIGEDLVGPAQNELLTRDMWDPDRLGSPGKVTSPNYFCGTGDRGGVHTNSGVPNHAFVMLVDGQTYNGQTVAGIGFTKAINIYFRAMTAYQVPTTSFADHDVALRAACSDLIGQALRNFTDGTPSAQTITASDCAQVATAMVAVEMSTPPDQCNYQPQLAPNAPPKCVRYNTLFADDFESGLDGWTLERRGPRDFNWTTAGAPQGRAGSVAFAEDPVTGTCGQPGTAFSMTSPPIVVPARGPGEKLAARFDHLIETEQEWDGGNVKISVNGGPFTIVPDSAYSFNAPKRTLLAAEDADGNPQNTNPKASERAFTGTDEGTSIGSWGTSIIDLTSLAQPGDAVRIQFDFGFDGCVGITGWFVDDFSVYSCPAVDLRAPQQHAIADDSFADQSEGFDRDGRFILSWTHTGGEPACGFRVEEAKLVAVAPFADNGDELLVGGSNSRWVGAATWHSAQHPDTGTLGYSVLYVDNVSSSLTMRNGFTIPQGVGAVLSFDSFEDVEPDFDFVYVEVSANGGVTFQQVFFSTGSFSGTRTINLSKFEGKTILVRFRIEADIIFSAPLFQGWFIDNISIVTTDKFVAIATVGAGATSYEVTGRSDGLYSYRIVGLFDECDRAPNVGPPSNVEQIAVSLIPSVSPTASFTVTPNPVEVNATAAFDASASHDNDSLGSGAAISRYHWSFGDGSTAATTVPTTSHSYSAAGTYRVALTVTDNDGETGSAELLVQAFVPKDGQAVGSGHLSGNRTSFGFDVSSDGTSIQGTLTYHDRDARVKINATSFTSFERLGKTARFSGPCSVNKTSGFTCTVEVEDNGSGPTDRFSISVSNGYSKSGTLSAGNVTVSQ